ncbi:MAG TPA: glycoside hydrolase family 44 protein, partial [Acidimicrobiales bacterium]|nr:glycoside hydrolase family 44 protein [Acidimicrobiales bacterium]
WDAYRSWVVGSVQQMESAGMRVDYWEVYNEPDTVTTTYYPPAQATTVTADRLLTQFLITYQAIKSVIPDARIIGPSLSNWTVPSTATTFSMQQFLNFAAANHLSLAALSWHYDFSDPAKIQGQVSATRSMVGSLPALGTPKIFINEYGIGETQRIPGWDVQYLAALTNAGVDSAGRECVSGDCWAPDLDGLLTPDGSAPLPDYWVRTAYGQMSGQMIPTSSSSNNVGAIASLDGNGSQVNVVVGYGSGCTQDPRCAAAMPWATPAQSLSTSLSVVVPWATGSVSVSSTLISGSSITAMSQPSAVTSGALPVTLQGGQPTVTVSLGPLADGDAVSLQLTHSS